ncbi:MAG TPA: PFL family protein, partial [Erysipelotrichaceae bacterium]|nr:PFL family protein [Erysipelotrichaceae bacterium]
EIAEVIKKTAFKITRMGQLVGTEAARRLGVPFGIVDLSLAPTPAQGDSIAQVLEAMGLEEVGGPGTTACLAMLNDAVKKGGVMASSSVGGLSGAFIPVSEDAGMIAAAKSGGLCIEKLEAMTAVCSVGLDMIVVPGDTTAETISGIIADEAAIGMINTKTTAVRVIPAIGKKVGEELEFGGLLGTGPVMAVKKSSPKVMIDRGGHIPSPINSLKN